MAVLVDILFFFFGLFYIASQSEMTLFFFSFLFSCWGRIVSFSLKKKKWVLLLQLFPAMQFFTGQDWKSTQQALILVNNVRQGKLQTILAVMLLHYLNQLGTLHTLPLLLSCNRKDLKLNWHAVTLIFVH